MATKKSDFFIWPMGAELPLPAKLEKLWDDASYVADTKLSGERLVFVVDNKKKVHLYTRSASTTDPTKPIELTHKWPELVNIDLTGIPAGTILDGEAYHPLMREEQIAGSFNYKNKDTVPDGMLYAVFDCVFWGGNSLENSMWLDRRSYVEAAVSTLSSSFIHCSRVYYEDKRTVFEQIVASGGEGLLLKNMFGKYVQGKKPAGVWVKAKKKDTFDCIIIGYKEGEGKHKGKVGSIKVGQYRELPKINSELTKYELIPVGYVGTGLTDEMRNVVTANKDALLGRVIVVDAYERVPGSCFLKQPRFKFLRPEGSKDPRECII